MAEVQGTYKQMTRTVKFQEEGAEDRNQTSLARRDSLGLERVFLVLFGKEDLRLRSGCQ